MPGFSRPFCSSADSTGFDFQPGRFGQSGSAFLQGKQTLHERVNTAESAFGQQSGHPQWHAGFKFHPALAATDRCGLRSTTFPDAIMVESIQEACDRSRCLSACPRESADLAGSQGVGPTLFPAKGVSQSWIFCAVRARRRYPQPHAGSRTSQS